MAKVKQKTHKATAKRFKVTRGGKLLHKKQNNNSHMKVNKSKSSLRRQNKGGEVTGKADVKRIKELLFN